MIIGKKSLNSPVKKQIIKKNIWSILAQSAMNYCRNVTKTKLGHFFTYLIVTSEVRLSFLLRKVPYILCTIL